MPDTEATHRGYSTAYNESTMRHQLVIEECNSAENWHTIVEAFRAGRARDIGDEPKMNKVPCFVLGSGASLDDTLPKMKGWDGGVFCSTSQARTLMYHGIEPTHIVCLDPFSLWEEIEGIDWSKTKAKLVLNPGIMPGIVKHWPNEMLFYIQNNGHRDSFYATTQKRMYTWRDGEMRNPLFHYYIKTEMAIFACTPPMEMFIADKLGYGTVFLAGFNWSEYRGKRRSTEYSFDENGKWVAHHHPYEDDDGVITSNNGRKTRKIHLFYKKNVLSSWRLSHQTMYNTDREGILEEVPFTDITKVMQMRKSGREYPVQSHAMINRISEKYLASVGAFIVDANEGKGGGVSFVESDDPELDLPAFMAGIYSKYHCTECKATMTADVEEIKAWIQKNRYLDAIEPIQLKDYTDTECPVCKKGKIAHDNMIDIPANMVRIRHLMDLVGIKSPKRATPPPPLALVPNTARAVNDAIAEKALNAEGDKT